MDALATIRHQITEAETDLMNYRPVTIDWKKRAEDVADTLVPWLSKIASGLKSYVQDVLNAPAMLRVLWDELRPRVNAPKEQLEAFDRQLTLDDVLRASVTGEVVSNVVSKYLIDHYPAPGLKSNSRSNYPDLYLAASDYSSLPVFKVIKRATAEDEYSASLKGPAKHPARVPDGLEIKTCRDKIAVDCHHPHAGLHFVLVFSEVSRLFTVSDVRVAFLRSADYRKSEINTTATTVKYSFNGDRFVSVLGTG